MGSQSNFNAQRQDVELLEVRSKRAVESDEKALYRKCLIDPPGPLPLVPIRPSHSANSHGENGIRLSVRFVISPSATKQKPLSFRRGVKG